MNIGFAPEEIAIFCRKWQVDQLALFGSVLDESFGPESDIDVLVTLSENARHNLLDFEEMESELSGIFGRKVDLVSRRGLETSRNETRRNQILSSAQVIYESFSVEGRRYESFGEEY